MNRNELLFKLYNYDKITEAKFNDWILLNKEKIENTNWGSMFLHNTITFKENVRGWSEYNELEFVKGDTYYWAVGENSSVSCLSHIFNIAGFDTRCTHLKSYYQIHVS